VLLDAATNVKLFDNIDRLQLQARAMPAMPIVDANRQWSVSTFAERHLPDRATLPVMICYPEKSVGEAVEFFATRFKMHHSVYTHKSVKQIEFMVRYQISQAYHRYPIVFP
jgi:HD superfamily phosphohydrolase